MNSYDVGDWVRFKGLQCRVLGHWHDKNWNDWLILGLPSGFSECNGLKHVRYWKFAGKVAPGAVELIKRRPKEHAEVTEG